MRYLVVNRSLGLLRSTKTGILYFRKYVTGVGRAEISLRTKDVAEAERIIFRTYSQFIRTPPASRPKATFDEIVSDIYEINQGRAEKTFSDFEGHCRLHLLPYFTGFAIDTIAAEWPKYVAFQHKKNPNRQLGHDRKAFVRILSRAVERGDLPGMPIIRLEKGKRIRQPISTYTESEVRMILTVTPEYFVEKFPNNQKFHFKAATLEKLQLQFELVLFSGMRPPGEVNALRYSWIDFQSGTAHLPAQVTKTREGRTYPIDPHTLEKLRKRQATAKSDLVFPKRGEWNQSATAGDKTWQRFREALGIDKKRYWARHTHATEAVASGTPEATVTKNMGTSPEMFRRVYNRPGREAFERQATAVRRRFFKEPIGDIGEQGANDA